jgi:predicted RNA-binding Zn ribbon-like protein
LEADYVSETLSRSELLGGRLAVNFANAGSSQTDLSWEELIHFLEKARIISPERSTQLMSLPQGNPQAAEGLFLKALRLRDSLRKIFVSLVQKERIAREWAEPVNEVLRITEGHDELVLENGEWRTEFMAREGGLDWLLAAIARSAAEIVVEGESVRLRLCANPNCGLFFCDTSRTRRRRWCSMSVCGNRHKVAAFARKHARHGHEA